ncbi:MAG TPA: phosphatase PAP2 family protein [Bradyrhizobium sp.]|nr:phosphatase PAP2 family protein [Bradyrhizobium sp.]
MNESEVDFAWQAFRLNWLPVVAMGAALFGLIACTDFSLEPLAFGTTLAIGLSLALVAYGSELAFTDPKLIFWSGSTAQVITVTAIVGPLSYVANAVNWPLQDHTLLLIDRAVGLDPQWIAAFVNDHGWLVRYLNKGYGFIKWPLLGIPIVLTMSLRLIRLQQFVLALNIALAVTIVISIFVPAVGTYYGLNLSPAERFPLLDSSNFAAQLRDIIALRNGSLRHLELFKLAGIVSFPSFHTASAVLYCWALWPVRACRWIAIGLGTWMVAATPVIGAHYIIDLVGGAAVAGASIVLAIRLLRKLASKDASAVAERPAVESALGYQTSQ